MSSSRTSEDEACHWVEVAGKGIAPEPERLKWDGTTTSERVHDKGLLAGVSRAYQASSLSPRMRAFACVVPVGEVSNEPQERALQPFVGLDLLVPTRRVPWHREQGFAGPLLEAVGAVLVTGIRKEEGQQHRAGRGKGAPSPPQVKGRGMPLTYRLLPLRLFGNFGDGEVNLGEAFALLRNHRRSAPAPDAVLTWLHGGALHIESIR